MHTVNDVSMGSPETVDRCLLSPSKFVTRVVLWNTSLPHDISTYTLTYNISKNVKYRKPDPKWFERLQNSLNK
jgi:hypothetical protein